MGIFYRPSWLQKMFPGSFAAQPESSREKLRDVLLEAIEERANTSIRFDCGVWDIREGSRQNTAELLDRDSKTLGEFDLVVDGMGLHSTLRQHRVDDPTGKSLMPSGLGSRPCSRTLTQTATVSWPCRLRYCQDDSE